MPIRGASAPGVIDWSVIENTPIVHVGSKPREIPEIDKLTYMRLYDYYTQNGVAGLRANEEAYNILSATSNDVSRAQIITLALYTNTEYKDFFLNVHNWISAY